MPSTELQRKTKQISDLVRAPYNPWRIDDRALTGLRASVFMPPRHSPRTISPDALATLQPIRRAGGRD